MSYPLVTIMVIDQSAKPLHAWPVGYSEPMMFTCQLQVPEGPESWEEVSSRLQHSALGRHCGWSDRAVLPLESVGPFYHLLVFKAASRSEYLEVIELIVGTSVELGIRFDS